MSDIYYRHFRKMNNWQRVKMWTEKKLLKPHKYFGVFKMFDTENAGPHGGGGEKLISQFDHRIKKFIEKYPHVKDFAQLNPFDADNYTQGYKHPIARFLAFQNKYIDEGFTEDKAFELAEKDMSEELQKEKYERSLFEGLATSNRSRSLMSIYEQQAEYESRQKVAQLNRGMGSFKRFQGELEQRYEDVLNEKQNYTEENEADKQENLPNKFKYEPVTYRTAEMKENLTKNPSFIQNQFSARSEKLLDYFHSFSEIKDGISGLTDQEIILKANETPQKLKDSFNTLKKKLSKFDITLDESGHLDYSKIKDSNVVNWIKQNSKVITVFLLCQDLDFEAPHIISRNEIKNKILTEIQEEEKRLQSDNAKQAELASESEIDKLRKNKTNYENFFGILPNYNADILVKGTNKSTNQTEQNIKKYMKYEDFVKEFSDKYMFDNDLLYETYYYWEDLNEKEMRLRELWINSRKVQLERKPKRPESAAKEMVKTNEDISELVRGLRRKIDQSLLKNKKHPIFGANYRYLKKSEFLLDSEIEFHKIKKFLENPPEKIQLDPEISVRYFDLLDLMKRKKIGEETTVPFEDPIDKPFFEEKKVVVVDEDIAEERGEEKEALKLSGKSRSSRMELENSMGQGIKLEKMDEEIGKVKSSIVSHFENIIKTQVASVGGVANKKEKKTEAKIAKANSKNKKK